MPKSRNFDIRIDRGRRGEEWPGPHGLTKTNAEIFLFQACPAYSWSRVKEAAERALQDFNIPPNVDFNHRLEHEIQGVCVKLVDDIQDLFEHLAGIFQTPTQRNNIRKAVRRIVLNAQTNVRRTLRNREGKLGRRGLLSNQTLKLENPDEAVGERFTILRDGDSNTASIPPTTAPAHEDVARLHIHVYEHRGNVAITKWALGLIKLFGNRAIKSVNKAEVWDAVWKKIDQHCDAESIQQNRNRGRHLWEALDDGEEKGDLISNGTELKNWLIACGRFGLKPVVIFSLGPVSAPPEPIQDNEWGRDDRKSTPRATHTHTEREHGHPSKRSMTEHEINEPATKRYRTRQFDSGTIPRLSGSAAETYICID
ncbi:MAG: hypothetical protein Q9160_004332 [Pyrenula sp. 1 TL-2023]